MGEPVKLTVFWVLAYLMADRRPEILVNSTFLAITVFLKFVRNTLDVIAIFGLQITAYYKL